MKRLLIIGGGSLLLLLGVLIGAVYGSARTANANTTTTTASTSFTTANTSSTTNNYCAQFQQDLAKRLGVSSDKLQSAESGAAKDMIEQMVKDGKITQAQATQIESQLGNATNCNFQSLSKGNKAGFANMQKLQHYLTAAEGQVAKGLGMSSADLTSQLQSGKSLHDIATAHKVSDTQLKTLLTTAIQSELKQAVSAGDITQSQSDMVTRMLSSNPTFLNRLINAHKGQQEQGVSSTSFGF